VIDIEILPSNWYANRELTYTPKHFVISSTPLTPESKIWILNKLSGRFSVVKLVEETDDTFLSIFSESNVRPAFEDPKELVFYELTWS
jgi:hypothetical protein